MRKILLLLFLLNCTLFSYSQDFSNKGKEFWVAYGYHQVMLNGNPANQQDMVLYFATDQVTTITISIPGTGYSQVLVSGATPTVLTSAPIPKTGLQDARLTTESTSPENKGIRVVSDKPIVAYAHIYNASVSGASILFPTSTLGKEYYSVNYTNISNTTNANCWMYVIAADTGTTIIEIIPSVPTLNHAAGVPFQVTLTQGQVYNLMATFSNTGNPLRGGDLTGSIIKSISVGSVGCKRLAVFSGSGRISITCNGTASSSDNYMVQAFPKSAWGKKYLTTTTSGAQTNNIFRICVADPTTVVQLNGAPITLPLNNNFYYELPATSAPQKIESDKPILVSQYTTSQGSCSNGTPGDPEVIYLSPVEQSISKVLWNATPNFNILEHYFNVIIPNGGTALSSFKLDGANVLPGAFTVHPQDPNYSYLKQSVLNGPHTIESDSGFNAIAYGFGQAESYGYNAGTNVRDLYQKIGVSSLYGIEAVPSVCIGSPFKFKISLPYQPDSMYWDFHNPATIPAISNVNVIGPIAFDSVQVINTRTIWWYSLPTLYSWNTLGTFPITITTYRVNTEGCGNMQEIDFDLEVSEPPVAGIAAPDSVCDGTAVQFNDATTSVKPTYRWWWNFNDPASGANNISNLKNPVHTFSGPGTYVVRFANITTPGCLSDTITKTVVVNPLPTGTLDGNTIVCVNGASPVITFTGANATAPYTFTYKLNGGADQTISTSGTNSTVTLSVPTIIAGTFTYTLVSVKDASTTLCSRAQPDTVVILVNPLPTAAISGSTTVCQNAAVQSVTFTGTGGAPPYTFTYNINGGPALTATTVTGNSVAVPVPTNVSGTLTYNLTNVQGGSSALCGQAQSGSATIIVSALPTALISGTTEVCLNGTPPTVTFTGAGAIAPYTFTYRINGGPNLTVTGTGNAATLTVPTNVAGVFIYTLVSVSDASANVCGQLQSGSAVVTVNALPTASFSPVVPYCESKAVTFTDGSAPNAGILTEWTWDFGDPSSGGLNTSGLQNPTHIFNTTGSYTVTLFVKTDKGCISPVISNTITVNAKPLAGFIDPEVCLTDTWAQFTDSSSVAGGSITGWLWNFDDPASGPLNTSTLQNPQHSYSSTGPKNVTLYAISGSGCRDTIVQTFIVNGDIPVAGFNINTPATICSSDSVSLVNTSTVNVGSLIRIDIYWDNVGAPAVFETDLNPYPNKVYKHLYPFSNLNRTYNIRYKVYSGSTCIDEQIQTVTVNGVPNILFSPIPNVCLEATPFQITQASETGGLTPGPAPLYSGPGVSATGIFTPASVGPGLYTIQYLFISNAGCRDVDSQQIRVLEPAVANFRTVGAACEDQALIFEDLSVSSAGTITTWTWDFNDGTPVVVRNSAAPFPHSFDLPGSYVVTLTVTTSDLCNKSISIPVVVSPKPVPYFTFSGTACLPNATVSFTNASSAGTYTWNFGDPGSGPLNTSTGLNPTHIYSALGPYNVTLEVRSAGGCVQDTVLIVNTIHPQADADFGISMPGGVCIGKSISFTSTSDPVEGSVASYHWLFDDGGNSSQADPTHLYTSPGSYNVSHYIINSIGCSSDTMTKVFTVHPYPEVDAGDTIFVLENGSTIIDPQVTGNDLVYLWTPPDFLNDNTSATPITTPAHDIMYKLVVTSRGGCSDSDHVFVKVLLGPIIPNTFTPNNDNINDFWVIKYLDTYPDNRVQVFTRAGQLVFESRGYKQTWDGTIKGKSLPVDTYYYIIEPGNGRKPMTGYVTILK